MKYVSDYREAKTVDRVMVEIRRSVSQPWTLMEICGGQTHAIVRYGLDQLLPPEIELVHGPGCPVCVTPLELIDKALAIASRPEVIFCSYGDMLRVPGSGRDMFSVKAAGGDVRVVYSPLDAVELARLNPDKQVVFFAIGFETTAPANVMSVLQARALGLTNYSMLVSHVRVPPAMNAILSDPPAACRDFCWRVTCVPSWVTRNTSPFWKSSAFRWWSQASSRSISPGASWRPFDCWNRGRLRSSTPTLGLSTWKATVQPRKSS